MDRVLNYYLGTYLGSGLTTLPSWPHALPTRKIPSTPLGRNENAGIETKKQKQ